jgi:hypothetical protein
VGLALLALSRLCVEVEKCSPFSWHILPVDCENNVLLLLYQFLNLIAGGITLEISNAKALDERKERACTVGPNVLLEVGL